MTAAFSFRVRGEPKAKGSLRPVPLSDGRTVLLSAKNTQDWERLVRFQAQQWEGPPLAECALEMTMTFYLPRPASAPKRYILPWKKPDGDKLLRAVLDALTGIVYRDDAQVTDIHVRKRFSAAFVGLDVSVRVLEDDDVHRV